MNRLCTKNRWKAAWNRRRSRWTARLRFALLVLLATPVMLGAGCSGCSDYSSTPGPGDTETTNQMRKEFLDYALNNLNRLEEFSTGETIKEIVNRLQTLAQSPEPPPDWMADRLMATCPEPEMLRETVSRLNQWVRSQEPPDDWKPDPLLATLPEPLKELPGLKDLDKMEFSPYDGFALREAVWLRDVSDWARGERLNDLDVAKKVFDWTVRNVQLESEWPGRIPLVPWETLLFGRGTAMERARVFILLARQQGLDAALLALEESPSRASATAEKGLRPWAVAVLIKGELYLFDPALGLPVPALDGVKLDKSGQLDVQPASLSQVIADDRLLRQLDVSGVPPYAVKSSDLKRVVVLVEASPSALARRMKLIESRLASKQKMVLSTAPTGQAERLQKCLEALPDVADAKVRLWTLPFETTGRRLQRGPQDVRRRLVALLPFYADASTSLRKGRMLHLKGKFDGEKGAIRFYETAWTAGRNPEARPRPDGPDEDVHRQLAVGLLRARQNAGYWPGLIAFEQADYPTATDYFITRTLEAFSGGPWTHGARYNLARTFEVSGEREKAVGHYRSQSSSPAYHGNLLRARWLSPQQAEAGDQGTEIQEPEIKEPEIKEPVIQEPAIK